MFKIIYLLILSAMFVYSDVHFAKLEPYSSITIKSEVSGRVVLAKDNLEGRLVNGIIVKIDDSLDKIDLKNSKESLSIVSKMIELNRNLLPSVKRDMQKKKSIYERVLPLASSSVNQKNQLFTSYITAKTQYSNMLEKILNLKKQKITLSQKIAILKDRILKKSIFIKSKYLYSLNVKKGSFVNVGLPIAIVKDTSLAKLTIYLSQEELDNLKNKKIYIDNKETNFKFNKIWKITDKKYISLYRAEIILKPSDRFSKLIKIEIK